MRSRLAISFAVAAALVASAGCGSSISKPGGASATETAFLSASAVASSKTAVAAALVPPTNIGVSTPLTTRPPTGKTIVYLQCEVPQCVLEGKGLAAAAKALDWTYRVVNFQDANPATLATAMQTALQYKPIAVFFAGVPEAFWQGEEAKYSAAGAYIVPSSVPGVKPGGVVVASLAGQALYAAAGRLLAAEVIADSNGQAHVLFSTVPAYTIFAPLQQAFDTQLKANCPNCTEKVIDATLTQVTSNGMVPAIVSEVKRFPSTDYVVSVNGDFVSPLPEALAAASISPSKIKIVTFSGTTTVQGLVKSGKIYSTTGFGYNYEAWLGVDAVLRGLEKMPVSSAHSLLPLPLLVKTNIHTPSDSVDYPSDYAAQFKKLWLLS